MTFKAKLSPWQRVWETDNGNSFRKGGILQGVSSAISYFVAKMCKMVVRNAAGWNPVFTFHFLLSFLRQGEGRVKGYGRRPC